MALTLVRPVSLPYDGFATYGSYFGTVANLPATYAGDGSWTDDKDATAVTLKASVDDPGYQGSIVAVDFGPQPDVQPSTFFGTMFRLSRLAGYPSPLDSDQWELFVGGNPLQNAGRLSDAAGGIGSIPLNTPTTYTTGLDYPLRNYELMRDNSVTLVVAIHASPSPAGTVIDTFTLFECGLLLDLGGSYRRPSLRQLHRGGRGGIGGIPRAVGDRTILGSPRRGPGLVR